MPTLVRDHTAETPPSIRDSGTWAPPDFGVTLNESEQDITPMPPTWPNPNPIDLEGIGQTLSQVIGLMSEEEQDEYGTLRPPDHTYNKTLEVLAEAFKSSLTPDATHGFPRGHVSTDAEGGIRINWVRNGRTVRLVVPSAEERGPYVYWELSTDDYGMDENVRGSRLARLIKLIS